MSVSNNTRATVKRIVVSSGRHLLWILVAGFALHSSSQTPQSPRTPGAPRGATRDNAFALEQQGKLQQAEAAWKTISRLHPSNPEPYARIAVLEARQEHYKEAVPFYRKAFALNPNVPGLRLNFALALFKAGEMKEAIAEFEVLRKAAPANSPEYQRATILIGMAHYGRAEYDKAAPYLKEAAEKDPTNLTLLLALEHSYLWSHQSKYVLDVYHQILSLDPDSAEADMVAGEALDEMKDNAGAVEMFRAAVKAGPKEPNVHFGLGYLLWTQKQYGEAAHQFQAELDNDPDHAQAKLYLADVYIQMNRLGEAEPLLRQTIVANPSLALAHLDLGIVAAETGRNEEALREFKLAEEKTPDDVNVHWRLARLYRVMGKKEEAKLEFDKASTLNKKADDDLYKKIKEGSAHPPAEKTPPADPSSAQHSPE